jgi:hypothetical protein
MTCNLKYLGVALVAALAMSTMVASAASANANYWFTSDGAPGAITSIKGEQTEANGRAFLFESGSVTQCKKVQYTGSQTGSTATTLVLKMSIDCKFNGLPTTLSMGNCDFVIHTDPLGDTTNGSYDTTTTIVCGSGDITITATSAGTTKCIFHIPAQNLGTGFVVTNGTASGEVMDITAHIDFESLTYTQTSGTGLGACSNFGSTETHNGHIEGEVTLTGFNEAGASTDISLSTT